MPCQRENMDKMDMFERNSQAEEVFSAAWQQVLAGRSIESVAAEYPDYAAELEGMLRLAQAVRAVPGPALSHQAQLRIQARARAALHEQRPVVIPSARSENEQPRATGVIVPLRPNTRVAPRLPALPNNRAKLV